MKNVAVLFSGAKDSTFAIYKVMNMGMNVNYLLTLVPKRDDSYMFHHPNIEWTKMQADALEIEHRVKETSGEKEKELEDLKSLIESVKSDIEGIVSGALESRYQRVRIDKICRDLGLESISPHWKRSMRDYLHEIISSGFQVIITAVAADGLDEKWLGRKLDSGTLADLEKLCEKHGIHKGGEGGEYETLVTDGPIFKKRMEIKKSRVEWDGVRGSYIIEEAELVDKN